MLCEKELIVLYHLRKDSRKSYSKISSETKIPISTIHDIVKRLKSKGILYRNTSLINFDKMGFNVRIFLFLKSDNKYNLLDFLSNHKNLNSIKKISHGFDFLVEMVFRSLCDYINFKESIFDFNITKIREHHLIENIKLEDALFN